jgi:Na+/H+-dicarboxylate symporter
MNLLKRLSSLSLSTHVIIALLSGIAIGLFFGEQVAFLDAVGIAFMKLLQMTVIPPGGGDGLDGAPSRL